MYLISNAFKNLIRNKGRNILIGTILLIVIAATTVSMIINKTTKQIISEYKSRFGSEVYIQTNYSDSNGGVRETISGEQFKSFANSDLLFYSLLTANYGAKSDEIKAVDEDKGAKVNVPDSWTLPTMKFIGISDFSKDADFSSGLRKLIAGKLPLKIGEAIISESLANLNNLKIGDRMSLYGVRGDGKLTETHNIIISGIYLDNTKPNFSDFIISDSSNNRRNEIITNFDYLLNMSDYIIASGKYFLKEPSLLEQFKTEIQEKGLPDGWTVKTDEAGYKALIKPVESLNDIAIIFLSVVLCLGCIILFILSGMGIRERKYEIGVLRAMGMNKQKVMLSFITEIFILTCFCLILGMTIGSFTAQPVADSMIKNLTTETRSDGGTVNDDGTITYEVNKRAVEKINKVDTGIEIKTALGICGIALGLALVSSLMSITYIVKYEPMKILSERN